MSKECYCYQKLLLFSLELELLTELYQSKASLITAQEM
jgi:hypothetical protein